MIFQESCGLIKGALEEKFHKASEEISIYLVESFGNDTRIDYGTGTVLVLIKLTKNPVPLRFCCGACKLKF